MKREEAYDGRRAILVATAALWLASFSVSVVRNALDHLPHLGETIVMRVAINSVGALFCYGIHHVLRRLDDRPLRLRLIVGAVLSLIFADAFTWVNALSLNLLIPRAATAISVSEIIYSVIYWAWLFFGWTAMYLAIRYSIAMRDQERRWELLQRESQIAQMRAIRNQISPHFLFNTLNSISALVLERRTNDAELMIGRLADFFRNTLTLDPVDDIQLSDEIALQRLYLEIERVRFPDMAFRFDIDDRAAAALVPPLLLQPLIENAVKHGVARSKAPVIIAIDAQTVGDRLEVTVANDAPVANGRSDRGSPGIGHQNVRTRLEVLFGGDCAFEAVREGDLYVVRLSLPLRWAE